MTRERGKEKKGRRGKKKKKKRVAWGRVNEMKSKGTDNMQQDRPKTLEC